jgi:8-oxo-dGTP pyrophosphatase MutT (NUDIX family)
MMVCERENWLRHALLSHPPAISAAADCVAAAVLVPLILREDHGPLELLLTRRTDHLHHHPGQISFPGGRIEPEDISIQAAALREAEEEIGLPASAVCTLGYLPPYDTSTGFRIHPVIGLIRVQPVLTPDPFEVAEVLQWPLSLVFDVSRYERKSVVHEGQTRHYHALTHEGRTLWGATAGILHMLRARLFGNGPHLAHLIAHSGAWSNHT